MFENDVCSFFGAVSKLIDLFGFWFSSRVANIFRHQIFPTLCVRVFPRDEAPFQNTFFSDFVRRHIYIQTYFLDDFER